MHPLVITGVVVIGFVVIASVGWELYERFEQQRGYHYEHPYLRSESPQPRFEQEHNEEDHDEKDPEGKLRKRRTRGMAMKELYHDEFDAGQGSQVIFDQEALKQPQVFRDLPRDPPQFMETRELESPKDETILKEEEIHSKASAPTAHMARSRSSTISSFAEIDPENAQMTDDETIDESMYASATSALDHRDSYSPVRHPGSVAPTSALENQDPLYGTPAWDNRDPIGPIDPFDPLDSISRSRSQTIRSISDSDEDWDSARGHL